MPNGSPSITMSGDLRSSMRGPKRCKEVAELLRVLQTVRTEKAPRPTIMRAAEVLPLTKNEIPEWLSIARPKLFRRVHGGKLVERRRVLAPWFVYGWVIDVQPFIAKMRADEAWCNSEGFKDLLTARRATVDNFDQDDFLLYFFCRYVMQKMAPYHEAFDVVEIVHGPLPGAMDTWAPNHYMIRLYDNRTPVADRLSEEVVSNIQRALKLRDPVWTIRYSHLHWADLSRR